MFWQNKWFSQKSIQKVEVKKKKSIISYKKYIKYILVVFLIWTIFYFSNSISSTVGIYTKKVLWGVMQTFAKVAWKQAKTDELWNVNILILWVGWKNHDGWYLTDSMMIASFNPKLKTVTFLSVPRDLYVKYPWWWAWKINYIFARTYLKTRSFDKASHVLEKKLNEITWLKINYYVLVDFWWFEKLVDDMWWITIDVPATLVDHTYPGPNYSYTTFRITKWIHHINGKTALKYARSRHSTSDFSRSARQEQIIKALIKKITSSDVIASPMKLKWLYLQFKNTIKTDFDFDTILSFVPYAKKIKIHSYVLNSDCYMKPTTWKNLTPWCFVYPAERSYFNGQAVLLPKGSTVYKVDNYDEIQKFVFIALWYPELWVEKAQIQILNGIEKKKIKRFYKWYLKPVASKLAYKLKNYWFNVVDVKNADSYFKKNTIYSYNKKATTEELLKTFVWTVQYKTWDVKYSWSWFDMTLVLWEDYLWH